MKNINIMKTLKSILYIVSLQIILGVGCTWAQAPEIEWQKNLGGSEGETAKSIQPTTDGGYIVAGTSSSINGDVTGNHGSSDFWITKLNSSGGIEWQKSLGGSSEDQAQSIKQTVDNGYVVAGFSSSNDGDVGGNQGNYDFWIVKLSPAGALQWQKSLGGSESDTAYDISQTDDGGYLVLGTSSSIDGDVTGNHGFADYWLVKLNANGNMEYQNSYGGSGFDIALKIEATTDGGHILVGNSSSNDGDVTGHQGNGDYWIVKITQTGSLQWQKTLGGSEGDYGNSIRQAPEGGYIVAGSSYSNDGDVTGNHGSGDYWIVKLSQTGNLEWQKSLGGSGEDIAQDIQVVAGGYIVIGGVESSDGDITGYQGSVDYWTVKLNEMADIQWQKTLGGSSFDEGWSIEQTNDNGFIVAGGSYSNDGDVTGNQGGSDYWIVKLEPDPLGVGEFNNQINIYPNPVSDVLNFQANEPIKAVLVFNQLGQKVMDSVHDEMGVQLNISALPTNLYFVVVETGRASETYKIIVR